MKHFKNIKTKEQLRTKYMKLLKENHPDKGGDLKICQEIIGEYQELSKKLNLKVNKKDGNPVDQDWANWMDSEISRIIEEIINIENIQIEIIGFWIWVSGETTPVKELLKEKKFFWSGGKKAWYWNGQDKKVKYSKCKKLDDIRDIWGSKTVKKTTKKTIKKIA